MCCADVQNRPCCLRRGGAVAFSGTNGQQPARASPSASKERGRAERRTHDAPAASCVKLSFGHTRFSHHENTDTSGVPHAMVFAACFACPPVGESFVTHRYRGLTGQAPPPVRKACVPVPCYGVRHHAGSTRLGPTREAMSVRRISAPAASHSVVVSLGSGLSRFSGGRTPLRKRKHPCSGLAPSSPSLRPDAAASTASRPAYRDDREPPLLSGTG
jgi:hypothetical protein